MLRTQVQTFRRRNQASASETQLLPAEAQRNGSRFGANNLPIEEGLVQIKRVAIVAAGLRYGPVPIRSLAR